MFIVGFSQNIYKPSFIFLCQLVGAQSKMTKESTDTFALQLSDDFKCLNTCEFLSFSKCSSILMLRQREVSPIYVALQAHVNLYTTLDLLSLTSLSFVLKISLILKLVQISLTSMGLQHFLIKQLIFS